MGKENTSGNELISGLLSGKVLSESLKIGSVLASLSAFIYLYGCGLSSHVNLIAHIGFTDYLRVAVVWIIPSICLPIICGYFGPDITSSFRQPQKELPVDDLDVIIHEFHRSGLKIIYSLLALLLFFIMALVGAIYFRLGAQLIYTILTFICIIGWITFIQLKLRNIIDCLRLGIIKYRLLQYIPILLIYCFGSGLAHGSTPSKHVNLLDQVEVFITDDNLHISGELLFNLDKYVVIRENGRSYITLIPHDKISIIRTSTSLTDKIQHITESN